MNITNILMELDPTLESHDEGEWSKTQTKYRAFNDAGVECETGEFLHAMVRILKPEHVLETGTHWGIGASYLGMGVKLNGFGQVDTIEFLPEIYERAKHRIKAVNLEGWVNMHLMDVKDFQPKYNYDFILLDTEPQTRFAELLKFFDHLNPGGFVFIHDLHRHMGQMPNEEHGFAWPWGVVPLQMRALVQSGLLRPMHFPTPRGLTGFYKSHPQDFKWSNEAY